ncbi:hypothetical protein BU24DRAFT_356139 [Aaosphaeria arxii CBS 175.79]|uniref:ML-like domain-containing protein n=1 Tax=Aaosphaeria arxii CBS 175.79 TaxID=1450172 RepID=A0A6A5XCM3_9PLEO|nr:uncharacterized protein BU24DRAFT_356139 [Aaosphaeria arxii CBS 175.79]KAF2010670.1 hypothetical protein BU24DRAFT_356139 [Aaosphaeria arxii CBS 175.79]
MAISPACTGSLRPTSYGTRQPPIPSLQPSRSPPQPRRRPRSISLSFGTFDTFFLLVLCLILSSLPLSSAAFINFDNCLDRGYRSARDPVRLQFVPLHLSASFNTTSQSHRLNITVYGNVTGQSVEGEYPPPNDELWSDPKKPFGKITNVGKDNLLTTLFTNYKVLTFTAHDEPGVPFCDATVNTSCPIGPAFWKNASDPADLPAFTVGHDFFSTYSFGTLVSTMRVVSGDTPPITLACVSASITPDLGTKIKDMLAYLPAAILAMVAIATVFAATCSPWGSSDIFRWSSNYGRDEDLLRLVTPGFGDCLQYIQFIVLAGSLNLQYPGFFQPVVSQASWSVLLFNESLVSQDRGHPSLVDGIYFANGTYGISRLRQYVGMARDQDIWAGMAVWLLGIIAAVTILTQLGFLGRWIHRAVTKTEGGDLRGKNWPFTAGNIIRIVFNFFMLPIISLSLFQLVVAARSPGSVVATSVVLLIGVMGFAAWIFWFIFTTRPRAHLFDDLPTVLTYGPLYNTYSDDAAPFAFIPVLLTVMRGIAIGAIQPSGIAQIIVLAICEVILILTLHAFRPFQSNTSMNAYHTFFSAIRLTCTLLMISFVPSLGVSEDSKGWIGYAVLLLHAIVLLFGFFLNSLQTIVEVAARLAGAGQDQRGGLTKVFGKRQLSRRNRNRKRNTRSSLASDAAMLSGDGDKQSIQLMNGRARSLSGSSGVLLNQGYGGSQRASMGFENFTQGGDPSNHGGTSPGTPATNASPFNFLGGSSGQSSRRPTLGGALDGQDYYRPPRPRKATMDSMTPGAKGRTPSADLDNAPYADTIDHAEAGDVGEGPSSWSPNRSSITPAYLRMHRDDSDPAIAEHPKNTDYSVRESDFYYGLRGPALSAQPTRKLKTGPADPMGPVSSATGWFKSLGLFSGGKKKEQGKGFEVVRSTRMPPQMMPLEEDDENPPEEQEPYKDSPDTPPRIKSSKHGSPAPMAASGAVRNSIGSVSDTDSDDSDSDKSSSAGGHHSRGERVSAYAPALGPIDTGGGIELPSRIGSRASRKPGSQPPSRAPTIPRKSSKRPKSTDLSAIQRSPRLPTVPASQSGTPSLASTPHFPRNVTMPPANQHLHPNPNQEMPIRLPFNSTEPSPSPERSPAHSNASSLYRPDNASDLNQLGPTEDLVPPQMIQAGNQAPLATGYVHHHVARDSIHNVHDGDDMERSAEFGNVERERSGRSGRSGWSGRSTGS